MISINFVFSDAICKDRPNCLFFHFLRGHPDAFAGWIRAMLPRASITCISAWTVEWSGEHVHGTDNGSPDFPFEGSRNGCDNPRGPCLEACWLKEQWRGHRSHHLLAASFEVGKHALTDRARQVYLKRDTNNSRSMSGMLVVY